MNEHKDLEAELAALRPLTPSASVRQRIAESLAEPAAPRRSRGPLWLAALCGPIAAVLTFFLLRGNTDPPRPPHPADEPSAYQQPAITAAFDDALPSLGSYRRALLHSSESLNALLDKHAQNSSQSTPERARAMVFVRSPSELENLLGEL
jgi:hypothetical protein